MHSVHTVQVHQVRLIRFIVSCPAAVVALFLFSVMLTLYPQIRNLGSIFITFVVLIFTLYLLNPPF